MCQNSPLHLFCIGATKLDPSFPDLQLQINGYQYPLFCEGRPISKRLPEHEC